MIVSRDSTLFGTTTKLPAFVRIFVARHVISADHAVLAADRHPMADAKRLLDLNREAREQIAERVLQREADHHGADRRRRDDFLRQKQHRRDARTAR